MSLFLATDFLAATALCCAAASLSSCRELDPVTEPSAAPVMVEDVLDKVRTGYNDWARMCLTREERVSDNDWSKMYLAWVRTGYSSDWSRACLTRKQRVIVLHLEYLPGPSSGRRYTLFIARSPLRPG